ncbi:MAG: MgtC/SapB family protein [Gemmatimonadaceae bacterium]
MQHTPEVSASLEAATRLATAALIGLAVGIEREWSGHAAGPKARFAGLRTFLLLGMIGGTAGLLLRWQYIEAASAILVACAALVVAAYVMAVRRADETLDGTTEAAAMVVLALGTLAGVGERGLAAGAVAVVVFALGEKERLHWFVRRIGETEMRAGLQFAVLALVVLPALPEGPYLQYVQLRPRSLWTLVLALSALNFVGYIARRAIGASRGYGVTGLLGGLVSSTLVTLQFSRRSQDERSSGPGLALGVVAACTVLPFRVAAVSALIDPAVSLALVPYLAPLVVAGIAMLAFALRRPSTASDEQNEEHESPLRLRSAIQMAIFFQLAITALALTRQWLGNAGFTPTAIVLGLTDVDALTISMTRAAATGELVPIAARSIVIGILSNTVFKTGITLFLGRGTFRRYAAAGLGVIALILALGLVFLA